MEYTRRRLFRDVAQGARMQGTTAAGEGMSCTGAANEQTPESL
jgi:hypothetical protein